MSGTVLLFDLSVVGNALLHYLLASPVEVAGALLAMAGVWLNTRGNILGWPVNLLSTLCYIWVFFDVNLVGDFLLNIYFLVTGIYGWWHWKYGGKEQTELPVTASTKQELTLLLFAGAVGALLLGKLFSTYPGAAVPYADAIPVSFSLIAQWQLARKKIENWLLWIFVNSVATCIYFYKDLYITAVLYIILLLLAIKGYYQWKKNFLPTKMADVD